MIGQVFKSRRRVKVKPPYEQGVIPPTASHEHYVVINDYMAFDEGTGKYYWHSSNITWRLKK